MINNWSRAAACLLAVTACELASSSEQPPGFQGVVEFEQRHLGFEFAGRLAELHVVEGQPVQSGALLARLDDSLERAQAPVRTQEAQAAEARAKLVGAGSRPQEIRALLARIRGIEALEKQLAHNLARETELVRSGATPLSLAEELQTQLERTTAQRQELEQNLSLLRSGARPEEVAQAQAQAKASAAQLGALQERLEHYRLRAPVSGRVLEVYAEVGEVVGAAIPVVAIADTTRPYADVFVAQAEVTDLHVGQPMHVRVDGLAQPVTGHIEHIATETEFTPRFLFSQQERPNLVVRVRVRIDDEGEQLRAGIPAFVAPASAALRSSDTDIMHARTSKGQPE